MPSDGAGALESAPGRALLEGVPRVGLPPRQDACAEMTPFPSALRHCGMRMGMGGGMMGGGRAPAPSGAELPLLSAVVGGEPVAAELPTRLVDVPAPACDAVAARRELTFSEAMGPGGMRFLIDGRSFDPERVDVRARLGTTEEWTVRNATHMDPFHLHVNPFQVVARDGRPVRPLGWEDTTNVTAGSSVTLRIPFRDFPGKTVYHCHILAHEDRGMMGVVETA